MIDVRLLLDAWPWVLGLTAFAIIARPIATSTALTLAGIPREDARRAGLALVPLGEFSFLVAQLGVGSKVLPPTFYPMAVGASILSVFLMPMINRHGAGIVAAVGRAEPRWLKKALDTYDTWLAQLGKQRTGRVWWTLSRKRFAQIGLEMLFVTGLLIFSDRLLAALEGSDFLARFNGPTVRFVFWTVVGVAALIPLVAIWRNISALAMIFGETAGANSRVPAAVASTGIKGFGVLLLTYWLLQIMPIDDISQWSWLLIVAILVLAIAVFYRRLIYWHSEWQYSMQTTLNTPNEPAQRKAPAWTERSAGWSLNVQEHTVPERARCAGRTIGELAVRSRLGCTIAEIDRQGLTISAPSPSEKLYPGDRLLLLGEEDNVRRARAELSQTTPTSEQDFQEAVLESVEVSAGSRLGATLAELQIPLKTGVLLVGIERDGQRINNPSGAEKVMPGDRLLMLGTPKRLKRFREWIDT
jgi:CPA2 family monovalent cation:H+ antiporter-2